MTEEEYISEAKHHFKVGMRESGLHPHVFCLTDAKLVCFFSPLRDYASRYPCDALRIHLIKITDDQPEQTQSNLQYTYSAHACWLMLRARRNGFLNTRSLADLSHAVASTAAAAKCTVMSSTTLWAHPLHTTRTAALRRRDW
jgi:hypothetical protein